MKTTFVKLMSTIMLFGAMALAQSGDAMKQDDMKKDEMKHDQMKSSDNIKTGATAPAAVSANKEYCYS